MLLTVLSVAVLAAVPAGGQAPSVSMSIEVPPIPEGGTATIPIMITQATNGLSSAYVELTYDPSIVQVLAVGDSAFDNFFENIDEANATVRMLGFQTNYSLIVPPPQQFATVAVQAIGDPGAEVTLTLEGATFMGTGSPYGEAWYNSSSNSIVPRVPALNPCGLVALISALALLLVVTTRRR